MVGDKRKRMHVHKDVGLVRDVFKLQHMIQLVGFYGIGHVRYPTAGSSGNAHEAQPFTTNIPLGLSIAHNGNLTNKHEMQEELSHRYHFNTDSDSELMLSILADEMLTQPNSPPLPAPSAAAGTATPRRTSLTPQHFFNAIRGLMGRARGGFAAVLLVSGRGVIAFRDPYGIRPLCFGRRPSADVPGRFDHIVASESVAVDSLGYQLVRDVLPGEALWFGLDGTVEECMCHDSPQLSPCVFEYVYFGRPDSVMDGVSVYEARQLMGTLLAGKIQREQDVGEIDVVIPVPETSRISAVQCALRLGRPYEEGLTKNRYIARTFIMPGQQKRRSNVRKKLNPVRRVFEGKRVLLIDDSIVRGTTSTLIIQMCRENGAAKVYFCSASAPVRYPNVYGIDMAVQDELVAYGRDEAEVARELGADWVVYADISDMVEAVTSLAARGKEDPDTADISYSRNSVVERLDCSCFSGEYVTGDVDKAYLDKLRLERSDSAIEAALKGGPAGPNLVATPAGLAVEPPNKPPGPPAASATPEQSMPPEATWAEGPAVAAVPDAVAAAAAAAGGNTGVLVGEAGTMESPKEEGEEEEDGEGEGAEAAAPLRPMRGRQIAGINNPQRRTALNEDLIRLRDRFSGWS